MVTAASVTQHDSRNAAGPGIRTHFMLEALEQHFDSFHRLGPFPYPRRLRVMGSAKHRVHSSVGRVYRLSRDQRAVRALAPEVERRLDRLRPDLVFSPMNYGSPPLAYVADDRPRILWTDLTFPRYAEECGLRGLRLASETLRDGRANERAMLSRTDLAIYASDWAAESALAAYGDVLTPERVAVVPFGANDPAHLTTQDVETSIERRSRHHCRLLFVGVDWERKRGDLVVEVARQLNERGIPCSLDIIGTHPPRRAETWVRSHGFVDRSRPDGRRRVDELVSRAHFLVVPSASEAFGHVYAEASAAGVPSVATDVGGVRSVVRNGLTGRLFPADADAREYADFIADVFGDAPRYAEMARAAYEDHRERLNWPVAAAEVARRARALL